MDPESLGRRLEALFEASAGPVDLDEVRSARLTRPDEPSSAKLVGAVLTLVAAAALVLFGLTGAPEPGRQPVATPTTGPGAAPVSNPPGGGLVFERPLPWALVFDDGYSGLDVLDLNERPAMSHPIDGQRPGSAPYRLHRSGGRLVVGWGMIHSFDPLTLESEPIGDATIFVPAAEPSRIWLVDYPGGRVGPGPVTVWQAHAAGGPVSEAVTVAVEGHPIHGIPGGLAVMTDEGVSLWDAESGRVIGRLGGSGASVSDVTEGGMVAWCEDGCAEMRVTSVSGGSDMSFAMGAPFDPRGARFSDDGRYLAAPSSEEMAVFDVEAGEMIDVISAPDIVPWDLHLAWAPGAHVVFGAAYSDGGTETTLIYHSVQSGDTGLAGLQHGGTLSFEILATGDAEVLLGREDPVVDDRPLPFECDITAPDELFTPPAPYPADPVHDGDVWYGSDQLWTRLPLDGYVGWRKSVWWSEEFPGGTVESQPDIAVTWERLDEPGVAPIEGGSPGTNAYTEEDGDFMIAGIDPQQAGCWRVTATYKGASLSYVYATR